MESINPIHIQSSLLHIPHPHFLMSSNNSLSTPDVRNFTHAALYYIEQASYLAADSELSRQTEGMELKKTVFCTGFYGAVSPVVN